MSESIETMQAELARLRAENDKLRGQVEGQEWKTHWVAVRDAATAMYAAEKAAMAKNLAVHVDIGRRTSGVRDMAYEVQGISMVQMNTDLAPCESKESISVNVEVMQAAELLCAALNAAAKHGYAFSVEHGNFCHPDAIVVIADSTVEGGF